MKDRFGAKNAAHLADALPHADGGRLAHRAAADEQHRARGHPGAGGGAGRNAVAAHGFATTKRWRCPLKKRRASLCARSRSSRTNRAWRRRSIRWAVRTFVENLTLDMEKGAFDYFGKLDAMGGMVKAIERGYPQKEIAEASLPVPARGRGERKDHRRRQ